MSKSTFLTAIADAMAVEKSEAVKPFEKRDIGCAEQGNAGEPGYCYYPSCPSDYRSVFYDFGCPDGYKCCIIDLRRSQDFSG